MMNRERQQARTLAGIVIILIGILALFGPSVSNQVEVWLWIGVLLVATAAFGRAYSLTKETWAVIGAYATATIALLIFSVTQLGLSGVLLPTLVMIALALPFAGAWYINQQQWGLLIPAYVFVVIIPIFFFGDLGDGGDAIVPAYVMFVISLPFLVSALVRRQAALLIPGGIMLFFSLAFIGIAAGLSPSILTIIVPVGFIGAGVILLFSGWTGDYRRKRKL
ncbi:MAG: hypothetical protein K8L99_17105 [Anaerolineae bacterium]|nr:hypothetical protein [Anaerolineae bacterium]